MSKPKVLFLLRRAGPYHLARFRALAARVELLVVETRPASSEYPWEEQSRPRDHTLLSLPVSTNPEEGLRGKPLRDALANVFDAHSPDAVLTAGWADPEYHAALVLAQSASVPAVVMSDSTKDDEPRNAGKEMLKAALLRSYSAAVVAGRRSRSYLAGLGFPSQAIFTPWDVVDNDYFSAAAARVRLEEPGDFARRPWLCVARFIPKKNLEFLLEVYARLSTEGTAQRDLQILGSGPLEGHLREKVRLLGLEARVHFSGFLQYRDLPRAYARAHALLLPSLSDQWGLVVNEAMASGLPVLVSEACGCAPDLVEHGVTGATFSPVKPAELLERMRWLGAVDETEWLELSHAARRQVEEYSPLTFATGVASAVDHAMTHRRRPGPVGASVLWLLVKREGV